MGGVGSMLLMLLPFALLLLLWGVFWLHITRGRTPARMEQAKAGFAILDTKWLPSGIAALAFSLVYSWSSALVRRQEVEGLLRTGVVLLPVPFLLWFMVAWSRITRRGDELERRLQLEGAGFAMGAFMVFMMLSVLMDRLFGGYPFADMWAFLPLYYWAGLWLAKMRFLGGGEK